MNIIGIATFLAAVGSGLVAGIFYAFSTFVMSALGRLPTEKGITAMQSINVAVLNPWFFAVFFGTGLASLALVISALMRWGQAASHWLLVGCALYLLGCILVTMICNVPLNNALARVAPDSAEGARLWAHYLRNWTWWNHVRTAASLVAMTVFVVVLWR